MTKRVIIAILLAFAFGLSADAIDKRKLVIIAGKPSHPPRMHEFNAGVQLLAKCMGDIRGLDLHFVLNGWPKDEAIFNDVDAVVFYMDGGGDMKLSRKMDVDSESLTNGQRTVWAWDSCITALK